jgi:UDP-N-acetylglucosamine acyltransferase
MPHPALIHPTAVVDPAAELAPTVRVGPFAVVGPGVQLGEAVEVGAHAVVTGPTTVGARTVIHAHAVIGGPPQDRKHRGEPTRLDIGEDNVFREFSTANRGTVAGGGRTVVGDRGLFMAYSHIAHDCVVGDDVVMANSVALAGHVQLGDSVVMGGLAAVHQHGRVGRCAMVGGGAMVSQDVPPFTIAQGDRARLFGLNLVGLRRAGFDSELLAQLKAAYRALFHAGRPRRATLDELRSTAADVPEIIELVDFVSSSSRGICRAGAADAAKG